jgi:hypothetical protein
MSDEIDTLSDELKDLYQERRIREDQLAMIDKSLDPAVRALGAVCADPSNSIGWERTHKAVLALRSNYELSKAILEEEIAVIDAELATHNPKG